jgi:hypothetical protein
MRKLFSFLTIIAFLSVSFASGSHFHKDTENGSKDDCPLCAFSITTPVAPSVYTVPAIPVIFQDSNFSPAKNAVINYLSVVSCPRAPPCFF